MFITEVRLEGDLYWKQILETNVNITRYSTTPPTTTPKLGLDPKKKIFFTGIIKL